MKTNKNKGENPGKSIPRINRYEGPLTRFVWLTLIAGLLALVTPARAQTGLTDKKINVDVMQLNLYVGGGLGRVAALDPTDPAYLNNLVSTVTGIYYEIVASDPLARMKGVAQEIASQKPDIISVQEASLIRIESPGDLIVGGSNSATNVVYDYLQILVEQLKKQGTPYTVVATTEGLDVELPMVNQQTGAFDDVRLTDREAILIRGNTPHDNFYPSNPQGGNFTNVVVTSAGLPLLYGWCSVDMHVHGRDFRFICTHLTEETAPAIQVLQAQELFDGPANVGLPTMIVGDFNADPLHRDGSVVYDNFIAAGFQDAWTVQHPRDLGGKLTWGHDELLADPGNRFDRRIDLVLYKGKMFKSPDVKVRDLRLKCKVAPLWASDHAAVTTGFSLK